MPGSHARRSSSTFTTGKRRSSKSRVCPICSPIDARWSPSVVPIRHLRATWSPASRSRTTTNWSIAVWSSLGDERARRELAERGYQAFSARDQAAIVERALSADLEDVTHETAAPDDPGIDVRPEDQDHSADHQLRNRNLLRHKSEQERDQLLAKVERNPEDARSVFFLAQTYFQLGDFDIAHKWYARRVEMGGSDEEVYYAMFRLAESMQQLGEPWPDVEDAYLRAWYFRPTRAEPLLPIATGYRLSQRYRLAYLFAQRAAEIPVPEDDLLAPRRNRTGLRVARGR